MKRKGQSFLEYSLLIGCVAITIFAMQAYLKRGIQGVIKSTSDDMAIPAESTADGLQIEGARTDGVYTEDEPTTIDRNQQITTNEFARGQRSFVINQDSRTIRGGYTQGVAPANYYDYGEINSPAPDSGTTKPGGFGGAGGFGGGGAGAR